MQAMRRPSLICVAATATVAALLIVFPMLPSAAEGDPEVKAAREELRLRTETERRMRHDFESLLAEGRMSAQEIADFERYLLSLGMLVDEQRRVVARLEGTGPQGAAEVGVPLPEDFDRGQTEAEKIALLDAELGGSLSAFDEKLLREQQELAEKSRAASSAAARESGESDADAREGGGGGQQESAAEGGDAQGKGDGKPADGGEAGERAGRESGEPAEGDAGEPGEKGQEGGEQVASAGGEGESAGRSGNSRVPPDIPDGKDDDVVARQLREAAENEQDPELREKLWDEYRRYKGSTR